MSVMIMFWLKLNSLNRKTNTLKRFENKLQGQITGPYFLNASFYEFKIALMPACVLVCMYVPYVCMCLYMFRISYFDDDFEDHKQY